MEQWEETVKKRIDKHLARKRAMKGPSSVWPAPRYDDVYFAGVAAMEERDDKQNTGDSMTDPTEGPWECKGDLIYKPSKDVLCYVWFARVQPYSGAPTPADLEAVARIMAAAPKMKEALKSCEILLESIRIYGALQYEQDWNKCAPVLESIRASLAACAPKGEEG